MGRLKAHIAASNILDKAKEDIFTNIVTNNQSDQVQTMARVLCTAYKEAEHHRPAYGLDDIDRQELFSNIMV